MDLLVLFHIVNEGVINVLGMYIPFRDPSQLQLIAGGAFAEHYFEMSRYDAERGLEIYKTFTKQTADVVEFLQQARVVETATRLQIPNLKHAPTSLTSSLEEYLHDPEFDANRRNYLVNQEAKRTGKPVPPPVKSNSPPPEQQSKTTVAQAFPSPTPAAAPELTQPRAVAPDLIDFFESIESEQTPMFGNQQEAQMQLQNQYALQTDLPFMGGQPPFAVQQQFAAQTGPAYSVAYQAQNPYSQVQLSPVAIIHTGPLPLQQPQQMQPNFTGTGFGGYTPSDQTAVTAPPMPILPQQFAQQTSSFQSPLNLPPAVALSTGQTDTNPFRQSMMMTGSVTSNQSLGSYATSPPTQKSTNPFARAASQSSPTSLTVTAPAFPISAQSTSSYNPQSPQMMPLSQQPTIRSMPTGTNPFARNLSPTPTGTSVGSVALSVPVTTGGTNPFRQSMMVQQQQQQQQAQMNGNYSGQSGSMGGWENLETIPIFPRANNSGQTTNGGTEWSEN